MPRYRITEQPIASGTTDPATNHMLAGSAVFGLLMGVGFVLAGLRGRQHWLAFWGGGLVLSSIAYLVGQFMY